MSPTVTERRRQARARPPRTVAGTEVRRRAPARQVEHLLAGRARRRRQGGARGGRAPRARRVGAGRATGADPVDLLEAQGSTRVPELVPIRYGRMLVSPFTFYRGAAYLMASDLAGEPRTGLDVAAVRRRAPVELRRVRGAGPAPGLQRQRLRRDAPGPVRVGPQAARRQLRGRGPRPRLRRADAGARSTSPPPARYREAMRSFAGMRTMDLWYTRLDVDDLVAALVRPGHAQSSASGSSEPGEGAGQGQPAGARQAHARSSTASGGS